MAEGSRFDIISSTIILVGYAIPGFVHGILLIFIGEALGETFDPRKGRKVSMALNVLNIHFS